jgi:2-keto-4-pentenoate hydratase/2-oxohepta-3-ene-1,7-dioic acid hydratase in catechol pathway
MITILGPVRICSYTVDGAYDFGLFTERGIVGLSRHTGVGDLGTLIAQGRLGEAAGFDRETPDVGAEDIDAGRVRFERLLPWPGKILCIGVNYGGRSTEYADQADSDYPSVFVRFPDSLTGHRQPLMRPPESHRLDYEGEIVVVMGRGGRRIPIDRARDHIAGLTVGNEGTIRDWVRHGKFNVTQGKNWAASGAMGPWLVPMEHIGPFDSLTLTTTVNGERRQHDTVATMRYPIEYQVHYLSTFTPLRPGDVIFTGTPTGAGARLDPPRWLEPGDVVEVEVPGIGTLVNTVIDEPVTDHPSHTTPQVRPW